MRHSMKLNPEPFELIKSGKKTIELRLYDEKRQQIRPGDWIVFTNTQAPEKSLSTQVLQLHIFPSFEVLYQELSLTSCGYLPEEVPSASYHDMEAYYSPAQQSHYGVVGIEIRLL